MFGVTLRASGDTPDFWGLIDRAAAFEDEGSVRALDYPAHVSLALYDTVDLTELQAATAALADEAPLTLRFDRIATFDVARLILWLAPLPNERLTRMHNVVHATIGPQQSAAYYRPDAWIPHCTLAAAIRPDLRDGALAFAEAPIIPFDLTFDRIDALSFPPVAILSSAMLTG